MNGKLVELALRKQRLQIDSAVLRGDLSRFATGLSPLFAAADHVAEGVSWLRRHPQILAAAALGLLLARPRRVLRWTRRAFIGWQAWRRVKGLLVNQR
jgi:hypothetical protein